MLERVTDFIKGNKVLSATAAGVIISLGGANAYKVDSTDAGMDRVVKIEMKTKFKTSESGKLEILNVIAEVPQYRHADIKSGVSQAAVYCGVLGSDGGDLDFKNVIQEFTSDDHQLQGVKITIPVPNAEYDGKSGYGYFIVCGEKIGEGQIKTNYYKRIVYSVTGKDFVPDTRNSFKVLR